MNLDRLQEVLRARYEANPEDRKALNLARKVSRTLKRRNRTKRELGKSVLTDAQRAKQILLGNQQRLDRIRPQFTALKSIIDQGGRVAAFDAEWEWDGLRRVTEIGIVITDRETTTVYQIMVDYPDLVRNVRFSDGETLRMSPAEAIAFMGTIWPTIDALVGHELKSDFAVMEKFGFPIRKEPYFNTLTWSKACFPDQTRHNLPLFAAYSGVKVRRAHVAALDAMMVMDGARAVIERHG